MRLGTRKSALALWQANDVKWRLYDVYCETMPTDAIETVEIVTEGDRRLDASLALVGGKGLFVSELEQKLLAGEIDFAVHSLKDMPAKLPEGLVIGAVLAREDPRDVWLSATTNATRGNIDDIAAGARVGTASLRRECLLRRRRPDLNVVLLRGNVETRLRKLCDSGEVDAIVLAACGLKRLGYSKLTSNGEYVASTPDSELDIQVLGEDWIPAVGQGVLAVECRANDKKIRDLLAPLNDSETQTCITAERAFMTTLGGSCNFPIGAFAEVRDKNKLHLTGFVGSPSGAPFYRGTDSAGITDAEQLGQALGQKLLNAGGNKIVESL